MIGGGPGPDPGYYYIQIDNTNFILCKHNNLEETIKFWEFDEDTGDWTPETSQKARDEAYNLCDKTNKQLEELQNG